MKNNEFKKVLIKNRTCNYFNDLVKLKDFILDNILLHEKSHKNILIHGISYKTLIGPKALRIRFYKRDGFIKIHDGSKYWVLHGPEIITKNISTVQQCWDLERENSKIKVLCCKKTYKNLGF